jgi:hypothetical protein
MKPIMVNVDSNYTYSENGDMRENISVEADYDGKELEIDISDNLRNKKKSYHLSNEQLMDLMSHNQADKNLLKKLENELAHKASRHTKKNKRVTQKKRLVKSSKTLATGKERKGRRNAKNTHKKR